MRALYKGDVRQKIHHVGGWAGQEKQKKLDFARKSLILQKMGPRRSKIDFEGIILADFELKITFSIAIRVRNVTFE